MHQQYDHYTTEQQEVWRILFDRQVANLSDKATKPYLQCLATIKDALNGCEIARFEKLDAVLQRHSAWSIHVVPGLIPAADFLAFLAERKFCSSTWLRNMSQLDYLEEPDMFHDIFGHIPLLMVPEYADFMQRLGMLGVQYAGNEKATAMLERYYWFTIEFGLIREDQSTRIYGAGVLSSFGEAKSIFRPDVTIRPFCLEHILQHEFVKSDMQSEYFEIASFSELYKSLDRVAEILRDECIVISVPVMPAGNACTMHG